MWQNILRRLRLRLRLPYAVLRSQTGCGWTTQQVRCSPSLCAHVVRTCQAISIHSSLCPSYHPIFDGPQCGTAHARFTFHWFCPPRGLGRGMCVCLNDHRRHPGCQAFENARDRRRQTLKCIAYPGSRLYSVAPACSSFLSLKIRVVPLRFALVYITTPLPLARHVSLPFVRRPNINTLPLHCRTTLVRVYILETQSGPYSRG